MNTGQYKASIVILTHNNWKDTQLCLDSIFAKTELPNFEVIVVDNASQDGTPDHLIQYASQHQNFQVKINIRNEGFARGNNLGAGLAQGEYLVFLNNDTVVTSGWLSGLIQHLQNPQVGMVGPVTNSASNESRILVDYESLDDLDEFALQYTNAHQGIANEIRVLAFFCVALRRSVFEEIGPLDERFGLGMFEDDDYAMRLREKDYQVLCAEDVFIHHSGGQSFLKLESDHYWQLFRENREKFESKWGRKWQPHLQRDELLRDQIIQISEHNYALQWVLIEHQRSVIEHTNLVLERDQIIRLLRQKLDGYAYELKMVHLSRTWKLVQTLRRIRRQIAPEGSFRERMLFGIVRLVNWARNFSKNPVIPAEIISEPFTSTKEEMESLRPLNLSAENKPDRTVPILIPQFYNYTGDQIYIGGAERYLVELCRLIRSLDYEPIVYQSARESWTREYEGIPVIGLPSRGDNQKLNELFHERISPDVLVIYFAFYLALPHCNPRSIGISHGVYWDTGNHQPLIDQQERLSAILDPSANLSRVASVDTNTINWVRGLQSYMAKKFVYIPNFVDLDQFKVVDEKISERLVVLYPRRLYEPRGFWLVKEIIPDFVKRYPEIEFHFVGQAEPDAEVAVRELLEYYPRNVRWSTLPFEEMHSAYETADITLIPTVNSEGTSLSCLEAMAAGNAVIASNVGGLTDLIISDHNGILIDPTVRDLVGALDLLCKDQELRQSLGNRAQIVAETFNIHKWRASWTKLLKEFLI
jgi:GT2 family glycosyltransferase/glycosyltransferase involved in cell wall biosynthesis